MLSEMKDNMRPSPLVRTTGTNSRDDDVIAHNRVLPANFHYISEQCEVTTYQEYELTQRQISRLEEDKYYYAIKVGVRAFHGTNRYAVHKSQHRMFIKDGSKMVFSCLLRSHNMRCAYLEMMSVQFDVNKFLAIVHDPSPESNKNARTPEYILKST
jgi:hypothetical protein